MVYKQFFILFLILELYIYISYWVAMPKWVGFQETYSLILIKKNIFFYGWWEDRKKIARLYPHLVWDMFVEHTGTFVHLPRSRPPLLVMKQWRKKGSPKCGPKMKKELVPEMCPPSFVWATEQEFLQRWKEWWNVMLLESVMLIFIF